MESHSENKRIAINSAILYFKLILTILVNFVSTRLILSLLGASDFGLYNVVGGLVVMINTLGTTMVSTSYRFIAVELGKGDSGEPNRIYNTVFVVHVFLAILLLFLGETIGVFYVNNYLNIDVDKLPDALYVLHLSLLTTAVVVLTVPMNGLIIAREKFLFSSLISILDILLKLFCVIGLFYISGNKLRMYATFFALIQLITPLSYQIYCRITDKDIVKWNFNNKIDDYKGILSFAGWILFGAVAVMGKVQGAAIIINKFFGTVLNASFGVAGQVSHAVSLFSSTLQQASVPQIMKNQEHNEKRSLNLVYTMARFSFFAMMILSIPLLFCINELLRIWLDTPPQYTDIFVAFMLIDGMITSLGAGFDASIQATGKIKINQIGYSVINISLLPIIFVLYKLGAPPYSNVIVMSILSLFTLLFQIHIMQKVSNFNKLEYLRKTLFPCIKVIFIVVIPLVILKSILSQSMLMSFFVFAVSVVWTLLMVYLFGLFPPERQVVKFAIKKSTRNI